MRFAFAAVIMAVFLSPAPLAAQSSQTLADIRQELTVLHVEIQRLKRELSTTGAPGGVTTGASVLERVSAIEAELQRLTAQTEQMQHRIDRVVSDGTNRIGDLEFRLCELEIDCDISKLPEASTLGGGTAVPQPPVTGNTGGTELAVGEEADFKAAEAALEAGDFQRAVELFAAFDQSYPGSPLAAQANLNRGRALDGLGDTREAARAYLASFSGNSTGPVAPVALFELGAALGRLGQVSQACVTLAEVAARFPAAADPVASARGEMTALGCS
ncbi:tol-pal system protein YbgF [Seohaeicola saemankumensis]|nr:tol-pal system protein YbgF [Seohaeicola saemankumensis]MCA0873174.1 tol-pal system protein YbgF [Seohaeicola saemankumensis]